MAGTLLASWSYTHFLSICATLLFRAREQRRILRLVDPRPLGLFVRRDTRTSNEHRYCSVCKCGRVTFPVTFPFLSLFRASFPPFVASPKLTRKSTTYQHAGSFT